MSANPAYSVITGTGKPRLIKELSPAIWISGTGTTFTAATFSVPAGIPTTVLIGMRVRAKKITTVSGQDFETVSYAKILSVDYGTDVGTVDEWVNGTPTAGQVISADGYIADLDRTLEGGLAEEFTPLAIIHELYPNTIEVEERGWGYLARLDYEKRVTPDMFREMRNVMTQRTAEGGGGDQSLIFIPRVDKPNYHYKVYIPDKIRMMLHPSYRLYKDFSLTFKGKQPIATPPHFQWSGYGMNYSRDYGIGL